jgi:hypothetical protein
MTGTWIALLPTRARWFPILALVFIATLINHLTGCSASRARNSRADLGMTNTVADSVGVQLELRVRADSRRRAAGPFGTRLVYFLSLIGWSVMTMLQGTINGLSAFVGSASDFGVCEAPCFPANSAC